MDSQIKTVFKYRNNIYQNSQSDWKQTTDINEVVKLIKSGVCFIEVLEENRPVMPYFDLDFKKSEFEANEAVMLSLEAMSFIAKEFNISESEFCITESKVATDKWKSYHITIPSLFTYKESLRNWFNNNKQYIKDNFKSAIDSNVYMGGGSGHMRHQFTPKTDKSIGKICGKMYQGEFLDSIIQNVKPTAKEWKCEAKQVQEEIKTLSETISYVDADEIRELFNECFDKSHLEDYNNWLTFTFAFHSIDAFDLWDELCSKCKGYNQANNFKTWINIKEKSDGVSIGTFYYLCRQMNQQKYDSIREKKADIFESFTNRTVSMKFYELYKDKYLYSEKLGWYSVNENNVWIPSENKIPTCLVSNISNSITKVLNDNIRHLLKKKEKTEEEKQRIKEYKRRVDMVGGSRFCANCIEFLMNNFEVKELEKIMDENRYLFAFNDKVVDLKTMEIRNIRPTDYISITTGYDYPKRNDAIMKDILAFISTIFENADNEMYLLKTVASCILGVKRFEEFYLWNGRGSNGKGTLNELIMTSFGNYYKTLDSNVLTKTSKNANEATPALYNKKGCRVVVSTEPENDTGNKLQVNLLKKITGGDTIETRGLFKACIEYKPQFGLMIQCNDIPEFTTIDQAIERRLRIINFPFTFNANPILPFHRKGDPYIKEVLCKSAEWRDNFMLILLDVYKKHIMNAKVIELPEGVKNDSKEFFEDANPTIQWIKEKYDITSNKKDKIKPRDLYEAFKVDTKSNITEVKFSAFMKVSGFEKKKSDGIFYYNGLKRKQENDSDDE